VTVRRTLRGAPAGRHGYRQLVDGPGEPHVDRVDLAPAPGGRGEVLIGFAHLSDLHVCDAQSPARAEFLDRWADPDSPIVDRIGEVGTYRAQEILTAQVVEATTHAINSLDAGPVGGRPLALAIVTGDNTDNAQANELAWYLALLDGGPVRPDSGDLHRYEGVADDAWPDLRYWHPEGGSRDRPRERFGFPETPGLLEAARAQFDASGLELPWLAVHGNHDRLLQGTVPGAGVLAAVAVGARKPVGLPSRWTPDQVASVLGGLAECEPAALKALGAGEYRMVTADAGRRIVSRAEFVSAHFHPRARPCGHGFGRLGTAYYRYDHESITFLVLDTVNEHGGWEGSLDRTQAEWLESELAAADDEHRYVVLASHHPTSSLVNGTSVHRTPPRMLAAELTTTLTAHPSVVLWVNGHTHRTSVTPHGSWWEVTAPSLIDWPQQARVIEVLRGSGVLTIATTMLDHSGQAPWSGALDTPAALAGLSRELAANDWQWRASALEHHPRAGSRGDRNARLHLPDPWR
jgi:metallophosphoesterase (TIGR03767 family)